MSGFRLITAVLLLGSACYSDESFGPSNTAGVTRVLITDAPFPYGLVDSVKVYVVEIAASMEPDTSQPDAWATIASPGRRFELLSLQQGETALLGEGELPVGQYRAVRLTINGDSSSVMLSDGHLANVAWLVAGEIPLHALVEQPLLVPATGAQMVIDFDVGRSFIHGLMGPFYDFAFSPVLRAVDSAATGTLRGRVFGDVAGDGIPELLEDATVTVFSGNPTEPSYTWWVTATGHTAEGGSYRVGFLLAGTYIVQIDAPAAGTLGPSTVSGITIVAGEETGHSVTLPRFSGSSLAIEGNLPISVGDTLMLRAVVRDVFSNVLESPSVRWHSVSGAARVERDIGEYTTIRGLEAGVAVIVASSAGMADSVEVEVQ
jgi:hypothetical protein